MRDTFSLLKDLESELAKRFEKSSFPVAETKDEFTKPIIRIGRLAPKRSSLPKDAPQIDTNDSPPFIVVCPWEGDEEADKTHEIKIGLLCVIWNNENSKETEAGYNYILNMIDGVRQTLFSKYFWANDFWKIKKKIQWKMGAQKELGVYDAGMQEHPFYGGAVIATFESPALEFPRLVGITDTKEA
jgi:hypothetical protein